MKAEASSTEYWPEDLTAAQSPSGSQGEILAPRTHLLLPPLTFSRVRFGPWNLNITGEFTEILGEMVGGPLHYGAPW